jgi:hypothetical protein
MWTCPRCGRSFRQRTSEHSCEISSVEQHLAGKPEAMAALYAGLERLVLACGPCEITALKTMIAFSCGRNFASAKIGRAWIDFEILLEAPLDSPRVHKQVALSPTRQAITLRLSSQDQLDAELSAWAAEAWAAAARGGRAGL